MAQKNSTIAARFARDGSFAVLVAGHGGELAKLVLDAAGGYSLLWLHKLSWQEASLRIAEGDRYSGFSVFAKSARSREAGAVEAYSRVFRAGRMTTRQLMIDPDGRWNTQLKDHRSDATVVTGTASGAVGSGYVRMSRRGTDQQGREMWSGDAGDPRCGCGQSCCSRSFDEGHVGAMYNGANQFRERWPGHVPDHELLTRRQLHHHDQHQQLDSDRDGSKLQRVAYDDGECGRLD